jgi:hypothetical protein
MKVSLYANLNNQANFYKPFSYAMTPESWRHEKERILAMAKKAKNKEHLTSLLINRFMRVGPQKRIRFKAVLKQFGYGHVAEYYEKVFGTPVAEVGPFGVLRRRSGIYR